jgi:hypothetical protein
MKYDVVIQDDTSVSDLTARDFSNTIFEVYSRAIDTWSREAISTIMRDLGALGAFYAKMGFKWASSDVTESLVDIVVTALMKYENWGAGSDYNLREHVATPLVEIGKNAYRNNLEQGLEKAAIGLWKIGLWSSIRSGVGCSLPVGPLKRTKEFCRKGLNELRVLDKSAVDNGLKAVEASIGDLDPGLIGLYREYLKELAEGSDDKKERKKGNK